MSQFDPHGLDEPNDPDFGPEYTAGCALALLGAIAAIIIAVITLIAYTR